MALIKCPECNNEISDTTKTCIHCGYKIESNSQIYIHPFVKKIAPIIIVLLVIFIIISKCLILLVKNCFCKKICQFTLDILDLYIYNYIIGGLIYEGVK